MPSEVAVVSRDVGLYTVVAPVRRPSYPRSSPGMSRRQATSPALASMATRWPSDHCETTIAPAAVGVAAIASTWAGQRR
jgi:hypothetical protein